MGEMSSAVLPPPFTGPGIDRRVQPLEIPSLVVPIISQTPALYCGSAKVLVFFLNLREIVPALQRPVQGKRLQICIYSSQTMRMQTKEIFFLSYN